MANPPNLGSRRDRVGELQRLFEMHFPDHRTAQGNLDVRALARDMGFSHETVYRCFREGVMKPKVAAKVLSFSHANHPEMPLYWDDLLKFILPDFERYRAP